MGCILYVMLTGRNCFRGKDSSDLIKKNRIAKVDYPDEMWSKLSPQAMSFC